MTWSNNGIKPVVNGRSVISLAQPLKSLAKLASVNPLKILRASCPPVLPNNNTSSGICKKLAIALLRLPVVGVVDDDGDALVTVFLFKLANL
jgi:hypothetical protein